MVKGISRQVIVVKSPDPRLFEQAIFILKEESFQKGADTDAVLQEARRVADGYVRRNARSKRFFPQLSAPVYIAVGAGLSTIVWSLALLL